MATFRNDSGDDLTIDRFGLYVPAGATFEIPDVDADSIATHLSIVRVASDVPAEIALPDEVLRDLVDVAGYTPADLDASAPDAAPVAEPASDGAPAAAEPTPEVEQAPVVDEPTVDEEPAAGDLDSFTQS